MSNKPSHIAYVVTQPEEGSDRKAIWQRVASHLAAQEGNGFDLVIPTRCHRLGTHRLHRAEGRGQAEDAA